MEIGKAKEFTDEKSAFDFAKNESKTSNEAIRVIERKGVFYVVESNVIITQIGDYASTFVDGYRIYFEFNPTVFHNS